MVGGAYAIVEASDPRRVAVPEGTSDILVVAPGTTVPPDVAEEMVAVLASHERHGAVSARFGSSSLSAKLPRHSLVPAVPAGCFLVRRALVENLGFLETSAPSMAVAAADLSLRLDKFGYSSVTANHAVVDAPRPAPLTPVERAWLHSRHRGAARLLDQLAEAMLDPVLWFGEPSRPPKVLVDLAHLAPLHNGTSKVALAVVDFLAREVDRAQYEVVLAAHPDTVDGFDLERHGFRIAAPGTDERFDLGYVPTQVFTIDDLLDLNRSCARIVVTDLDIISVRSVALLAAKPDRRATFFDAFRWADRVISISDSARDDALGYFDELDAADRFTSIPLGYIPAADGAAGRLPEGVQPGEYALVVGNWLPHKALNEAIAALAGKTDGRAIVVLGGGRGLPDDVVAVPSGHLRDSDVQELVRQSAVVVFPSLYEGFGLPIAEAAAHGRPIVLSETSVAREVAALFSANIPAFFAATFADLPAAVEEALSGTPRRDAAVRSIDDYCAQVWQLLTSIAIDEVDVERLRRRMTYFRQLETYLATARGGSLSSRARSWLERRRTTSPWLYRNAYRLAWRAQRLLAR